MRPSPSSRTLVLVMWVVILLTSALPKIILQEIFGQTISPNLQAVISLSVIFIALLATLIWEPLRRLRPVLTLLMVLVAGQWLVYNRIDRLPFYRRWLSNPSFGVNMLAEQSLNLIVMLLMIAALVLMGRKRREFYLDRGDIDAPVKPVGWLGVKEGERWRRFGSQMTIYVSLGTLAFLVIAGRPPIDLLVRALPYLPVVLLAAAVNAFYEEVTYKASFLSALGSPVGPQQALYMVAAYFGIAHYYGVPYGVIGVLLAGFMGWLLAKSMQETGGLFWAWFIHFWQDVWIFSFMAVGSIVPGGG